MIFIDFDDVIFNTKQFKEDLKEIFLSFGISCDEYDKTYHDENDLGVIKIHDPRSQIKRLEKIKVISSMELSRGVDEFMEGCPKYIFDDVDKFISKIGKDNIGVLSYGNLDFQNEKILKSGLGNKIEKIFMTDKLKSEIIGNVLEKHENEVVYFIDDRIEQILDVKNKFPDIVTILLKRPEGRYQEMQKENCCNYQASNLIEAGRIIKEN